MQADMQMSANIRTYVNHASNFVTVSGEKTSESRQKSYEHLCQKQAITPISCVF